MSRSTLAVLLVLVAGLGFLWLRKEREIALGGPELAEFPLCPELAVGQVRALRIDHLQRSFQLGLERDAAGRWFMTDPVAYPAQAALVRSLLQTLAGARGEPVAGVDLAQVGLDPPQVVVECTQVGQGGQRRLRIELGVLDLDPGKLHARVPGHPGAAAGGSEVFLTTRSLANTLERNPDDYRDPRVTGMLAQEVQAVRRRGEVFLDAESGRVVLDFDALLGPDGWKRSGAPTVSLDPTAMGLLARGATDLTIERYVDDAPRDLARYGLDPPAFTLELEDLSGSPVKLRFGHEPLGPDEPVGQRLWFCLREGFEHVWQVRTRDVELLTRPADLFFDQLVLRVLRDDVARLELEGGGARRVLEREKKEDWRVWEAQGEAQPPRYPGNPPAIEEALALLERVQLGEYLPREAFEPEEPPLSFTVVLRNGARLGGRLGRPTRDPESGAQGRQYLRDGDEVLALIGDDVAALCLRPLDEFRSRKVHQIQEALVRMIELEHGDRTYAFVNTGDMEWHPRGQAIGAPSDFLLSLDGLLNLGARRWLEPPAAAGLETVLAVRVQPVQGEALRFSFGRSADGLTLCTTEGGETAEVDPALVEQLLELF